MIRFMENAHGYLVHDDKVHPYENALYVGNDGEVVHLTEDSEHPSKAFAWHECTFKPLWVIEAVVENAEIWPHEQRLRERLVV